MPLRNAARCWQTAIARAHHGQLRRQGVKQARHGGLFKVFWDRVAGASVRLCSRRRSRRRGAAAACAAIAVWSDPLAGNSVHHRTMRAPHAAVPNSLGHVEHVVAADGRQIGMRPARCHYRDRPGFQHQSDCPHLHFWGRCVTSTPGATNEGLLAYPGSYRRLKGFACRPAL